MRQVFVLLFVAIVLITTSCAVSQEPNKKMLGEFARVTGMYDQIEKQKEAIHQQGAQAAQQYIQKISASFPNLPAEYHQETEKAFSVYLSNIEGLIDTDFVVNEYVTLISTKLSAAEMEEIMKFYNSDLGKKYTQTNIAISGDFTKSLMVEFEKKLMVQLQTFVENLSRIASKYSKVQ